jgi:(4S)-4-hydroxy-5-phosphonooxypentane-2,3-dione isomerase
MIENARLSRTVKPECSQFDICADDAMPATVSLYELYDDRTAFDANLALPHFKAFSAATETMIAKRSITTWQRIAP